MDDLAVYARHTVDVLRSQGVDVAPLLEYSGITPDELDESQQSIDASKYQQLLQCAIALHIPALGLLDGDGVSTLAHGMLGYAMYSSATLGKAIERHTRHQDLLRAVLKTQLVVEDNTAWLRVTEIARPELASSTEALRYQAEVLFALWAQKGPAMGLKKQWFSAVHFNFPAPDYAQRYHDYFGCSVSFNQPYNQFSFPVELLERPFSFANEEAAALCEQRCDAMLRELSRAEGIQGKILRLLAKNPSRYPNIQEAADKLHIGERSLRRRLAEEDTTYKELLINFRLNLAREYLSNTSLPLGEVAFLVGYSDPSNFNRAFVRQYETTPKQFREGGLPTA